MKFLASTGLISLLFTTACGDSGGASTGSGSTTETGPASSTGATEPTSGGSTTTTGATTDGSAGETTGATTTTTSSSSGSSGATSAVSETGETSTTEPGSSSSSSGDSDSSTGGQGGDPLKISIKDTTIYSNCQPIVDPDSILGWWTITYDNIQGAVDSSADLTGAVLTLSSDNNPIAHDITVTPTQSGTVPAGMSIDQDQMKQKGGPIPGCAHCDQPFKLELTFSSGGVDVPVVHEDTLSCVY